MRHLLVVGTILFSCAGAEIGPKVAAPEPEPEPEPTLVDFSGVFGGRSSQSIFDPRGIDKELMKRVMVEPALLAHDDPKQGIEEWTRRQLLSALGQRGSLVIGPPPRSTIEPASTAQLRNVRFISGHDQLEMRVDWGEGGGKLLVAMYQHKKDRSLCPRGFRIDVPFVQLHAQVQRSSDGVIVAAINELAILEPPQKSVLKTNLPDADNDPAAFCEAIKSLYATPGFAGSDARFDEAARSVLETGLGPLYVEPANKKTDSF